MIFVRPASSRRRLVRHVSKERAQIDGHGEDGRSSDACFDVLERLARRHHSSPQGRWEDPRVVLWWGVQPDARWKVNGMGRPERQHPGAGRDRPFPSPLYEYPEQQHRPPGSEKRRPSGCRTERTLPLTRLGTTSLGPAAGKPDSIFATLTSWRFGLPFPLLS